MRTMWVLLALWVVVPAARADEQSLASDEGHRALSDELGLLREAPPALTLRQLPPSYFEAHNARVLHAFCYFSTPLPPEQRLDRLDWLRERDRLLRFGVV